MVRLRSETSPVIPTRVSPISCDLPAVCRALNNEPDEQTAKDGNHSYETQIGKRTTVLIHEKKGRSNRQHEDREQE